MTDSLFVPSLLKLYKDDCNNDKDKLVVLCHWALLKNGARTMAEGKVRNLHL
jgi:hypothetical protein